MHSNFSSKGAHIDGLSQHHQSAANLPTSAGEKFVYPKKFVYPVFRFSIELPLEIVEIATWRVEIFAERIPSTVTDTHSKHENR